MTLTEISNVLREILSGHPIQIQGCVLAVVIYVSCKVFEIEIEDLWHWLTGHKSLQSKISKLQDELVIAMEREQETRTLAETIILRANRYHADLILAHREIDRLEKLVESYNPTAKSA